MATAAKSGLKAGEVTATVEGNDLVIRIGMKTAKGGKFPASNSGRTFMVASTGGNKVLDVTVQHDGEEMPVILGLNAYVKPE